MPNEARDRLEWRNSSPAKTLQPKKLSRTTLKRPGISVTFTGDAGNPYPSQPAAPLPCMRACKTRRANASTLATSSKHQARIWRTTSP